MSVQKSEVIAILENYRRVQVLTIARVRDARWVGQKCGACVQPALLIKGENDE